MPKKTPHIYLGHGASGGPETMQVYIKGLRKLGLDATALKLPLGSADRAMVALLDRVDDLQHSIIGGHSFGGRVSSMVAAEHNCAGLVLLSYPLHRPGHPEEVRTAHWKQIACPVLVLSGDRDQFGSAELMRREIEKLRNVEAHVYAGARHGLQKEAESVCERIAAFAKRIS